MAFEPSKWFRNCAADRFTTPYDPTTKSVAWAYLARASKDNGSRKESNFQSQPIDARPGGFRGQCIHRGEINDGS
jgi:hypothetical protein